MIGDVGSARQALPTPASSLREHAFMLLMGDTDQEVARPFTGDGDDQQVAQALEEILHETARIVPGFHHAFHGGENIDSISVGQPVHHVVNQ